MFRDSQWTVLAVLIKSTELITKLRFGMNEWMKVSVIIYIIYKAN